MASEYEVKAVFKARDLWSKRLEKMKASTDRFNFGLRNSLKRVDKFKQGYRDATAPVRDFGRATARTGVVVGVAAGAALKDIVDEGGEFEQTMASAVTKFGGMSEVGVAEFEKMKRAALDVGMNTEMSADQAAGALKFMAMAGEDPAVAMDVLGDAANFATAGQVELARATDIMSDAMGPLMGKVEGTENRLKAYRETMDLMTHATTRGNMGLEEMFEATKMGAAGFRGAGQDIEQFTASVAVLSNAGIKGSKAGKDLQRMMISLTAPSKKAAALMKRVKFNPVDADGTIKDFDVIMREMKAVTAEMTEGERQKFLSEVIGKNSMASALAIMENVDTVTKLAKEAREQTGLTAKQAEDMRNTTQGLMKGMESAFSAVKLEIFEVVKDDVKEIVGDVTEWAKLHKGDIAQGVKDFVVFIKDHHDDIIFWAKVVGGVVTAFVAVEAAIGGVKVALVGWKFITTGTKAVGLFGDAMGEATRGMKTFGVMGRGELNGVNQAIADMNPTVRGLGAAVGIAGAAFAGWRIGTWIDEVTGASDALADLLVDLTGLNEEAERMERITNRAATKSNEEILERKKADLAELQVLINDAGFFDTISGVQTERITEAQRLVGEISDLETKMVVKNVGGSEFNKEQTDLMFDLQRAGMALDEARETGASAERIADLEDLHESILNELAGNIKQGQEAQAQQDEVARVQTMQGPLAPGEAPPPGTGPIEPPAPSTQALAEEMAELARMQLALMQQQLDEQKKGNARTDRVKVTVQSPDTEGTGNGVTVDRSGDL